MNISHVQNHFKCGERLSSKNISLYVYFRTISVWDWFHYTFLNVSISGDFIVRNIDYIVHFSLYLFQNHLSVGLISLHISKYVHFWWFHSEKDWLYCTFLSISITEPISVLDWFHYTFLNVSISDDFIVRKIDCIVHFSLYLFQHPSQCGTDFIIHF